jgi:hypothetical protein
MKEEQREAMFNAWKNSKINLIPQKEISKEEVTISVTYKGEVYTETFSKQDDLLNLGVDYYNMAFNRLLSRMKQINKDIEIEYR